MEKQNFYFTFGQKYRDEPHPTYPRANPNGWVRIVAESRERATEYAQDKLFGPYFATSYSETVWDPTFFPAGEIECITL